MVTLQEQKPQNIEITDQTTGAENIAVHAGSVAVQVESDPHLPGLVKRFEDRRAAQTAVNIPNTTTKNPWDEPDIDRMLSLPPPPSKEEISAYASGAQARPSEIRAKTFNQR